MAWADALRIGQQLLVPAYQMPPALQDISVLRVVVRNGFSRDLASMLLDHLRWATKRLEQRSTATREHHTPSAFHH